MGAQIASRMMESSYDKCLLAKNDAQLGLVKSIAARADVPQPLIFYGSRTILENLTIKTALSGVKMNHESKVDLFVETDLLGEV